MSEHTKEPWNAKVNNLNEIWIHSNSVSFIAHVNGPNKKGELNADARRIIACVNACAGVPTEALEKAAECAEHGVIPTLAAQYKADADALLYAAERAYEVLIQERDCTPMAKRCMTPAGALKLLQASIAKARGISS